MDATGSRKAAHQMPHPTAASKQNAAHVNPTQQQPASHAEASSRSVSSQERLPEDDPACSHNDERTAGRLLQHSWAGTSEDAGSRRLAMIAQQAVFHKNAALLDAGSRDSSRQGVPLPSSFVQSAEQPSHASTLLLGQTHEHQLPNVHQAVVVGSQPGGLALTRQVKPSVD